MVVDFLETYAKLLVSKPEQISVKKEKISDDLVEITIFADDADMGILIGKEGRMINSIKTLLSACKAKGEPAYKVSVRDL